MYVFWLWWVVVAACRLSLIPVNGGLLFMAVLELLVVVASLVAECGLQGTRAPVFVAHRL